jgi:RNA polymerase sigma-70 factor (ECF subfamily)
MRDVLSDDAVVERVRAGEHELFELLIRRHNQRIYRTARAVVGQDADAEDAVQQAWILAWRRLETYDGRAAFTTWMTRIALRAAWRLARRRGRADELARGCADSGEELQPAPDAELEGRELGRWIERSLDALDEPLRVVFVLRVLEGLSTAQTALDLGLSEAAVRVRLHRARSRLRDDLLARAARDGGLAGTWPIGGERCDRIVAAVLRERALAPRP